MQSLDYRVIIIGGGHAGIEAAWAAANLLAAPAHRDGSRRAPVALVTLDPAKIGVMSCNPAIGGLAKGQIVREIDALGGVMGLIADAAGIQFKVLNASKGPAVRGPRAQCDKHQYAAVAQQLIASRSEIDVIAGSVEELLTDARGIRGVVIRSSAAEQWLTLRAPAVVLTTGTFMRGLMHTGESKTHGGRFGEVAAVGISASLRDLGFELGRLKTGTPPRLDKNTIRWNDLEPAGGDDPPVPFSDLSGIAPRAFPLLPQIECRLTATSPEVHAAIRANLHRAPMYSGQIESVGPRYCPSIEDKVVRFGERESHHVFLEPESLTPGHEHWVYCNGISTSLPADVQDDIVRRLPGCENAVILRYGYAVEYDMVRPHQIMATGMTKLVDGLFLAGQINGTSGYEEAAAQGIIAGINAARFACGHEPITLGRDQAYIGVLMDDLVTKTPVEPYRMFSSRAEHRLLLRADNAADRLTPLAIDLGLLSHTDLGCLRAERFRARQDALAALARVIDRARIPAYDNAPLADLVRRPDFGPAQLRDAVVMLSGLGGAGQPQSADHRLFDNALLTAHTERFYAAYIERQHREVKRHADLEHFRLPRDLDLERLGNLRTEARLALDRFRPETLGQAARLEGITPADITLLSVLVKRHRDSARA